MNNRKTSIIIVSLIVISGFIGFFTFESELVSGGLTIYVGSGLGNDSATINGGIALAQPGDTVFVYSGTYNENVVIDKTINLTGEDKNTTIIDGGNIGYSIQIFTQAFVNVSGFTIRNGQTYGVYFFASSFCKIIDNIISNNNGNGMIIYWYSNNITAENNIFYSNSIHAVEINSNCENNTIANNTIEQHPSYGVLVSQYNHDNKILNNEINDTNIGIYLWQSNINNTIVGNTVSNSSFAGIYLWTGNNNNKIYHNNFIDNVGQAFDDGTNSWDNGYPGGGNFWGDYSGGDNRSGPSQNIPGNDGIGDTPYTNIGGGVGAQDNYPLWPNWDALWLFEPSPSKKEICEYAMGSVKVAVIFMESNGTIDPESENWSSSRKSTVMSEIQDGLNWWSGLEANASLTFSILDVGSKETSYEPITHPSTNESLWINEIMDDMGYTSGSYKEKVQSYNHWLRGQYNTDWAYTIFVVDSFNDTDGNFSDNWCAWAWWEHGIIMMTYDNGAWGISRMNNVTAHESGHMFYATDEYINPNEYNGYLNALEGGPVPGHLMYDNTLNLSSGTELQIGWRDVDKDGIMDILDTEPNTYLISYKPDSTMDNTPTYTGYAVVVPYPNNNPRGSGRDVSLNTIISVQYRIDYGLWQFALPKDLAFDEAVETFQFTTSQLSPGVHFIEARAINSVNNMDPTFANDTIMILPDNIPPQIEETTTDIPVTGNIYNITANVIDNVDVDTVWLEFNITSSEGYYKVFNVSMNLSIEPSYWYEVNIWSNATFFNYTIKANDTSNNWNETSIISLAFKVHNLDTGEDFVKIQDAIDDSDTLDGHSVFVDNEIYYENVVVDKAINLTGEDKENTIIDGGGSGDGIYITADWVNINEFTVTNGNSGIYAFTSSGNNITNCNISNNFDGIYIYLSSNITIEQNDVINNLGDGIKLSSVLNTTIENNSVVSSGRWGIAFKNSQNIDIINNAISLSDEYELLIQSSSNNSIIYNNISSNNGDGIRIEDSDGNDIVNNNVSFSNLYGIYLWSSSNNNITDNNVSNNNYGIYLTSSPNNLIYHNNMINNSNQAFDDTNNGNQWDNGYPSGGNFWSDYRGNDFFYGPNQDIPGNDGIGDTNYSIDADSLDNYPLMFPIGDYIFLYRGWNLISIPFIQSDTNLSSVLKPIKGSWDTIWRYNTSDNQDQWKLNNTSKPSYMNDLDDVNHTMGFWIHITNPNGTLFQYPGTEPTENQKIVLYPGWNLVGYPSLSRKDRTSALNNITFGSHVDSIWTYNAAAQKWDEIGPSDYFEVGKGYWIHAKTKCVWEVPL